MEWTLKEATALLTDSPWALSLPVGGGNANLTQSNSQQREGSGTCTETDIGTQQDNADEAIAKTAASAAALSNRPRLYLVRFVSATPVRMAIGRWAVLSGKLTAEQAQTMLNQDPYDGQVVVSVSASNDRDWDELNRFSTQTLKEDNYLLLKKSKRKIHAERYVRPIESGLGEALFYFSRTDGGTTLITPAQKEVSFNCRLSKRTKIRGRFKLEDMIVDGQLLI